MMSKWSLTLALLVVTHLMLVWVVIAHIVTEERFEHLLTPQMSWEVK